MERLVILKKLRNEGVIKEITKKQIWLKIPNGVNTRWIFEVAKDLRKFMKVTISICLMFGFSIANISNDKVWVSVSSDLTIGTDAACEEYWKYMNKFLTMFKEVHVVNQDWIPSAKIVKR